MSMEVQARPDFENTPGAAADQAPAIAPQPNHATPNSRSLRRGRGFRIRELILLSVLVVDAFLALDFLFRATAVHVGGFVSVVDRVGGALASPFAGIFKAGVPQVGHTTFWAALLALAVYTLAALVLVRLVHLLSSPFRRGVSPA